MEMAGKMRNARVLYVPNEAGSFRQLGFRRPFANLVDAGLLSEVSIYSLQLRIRNGGDPEQHRQALIQRVRDFQPDVVLMQHLGTTGLTDEHFRQMREATKFDFVYHEGDPYSRWLHPLPRPAVAAGRASDVTFTVGSGQFIRNFERHGASDVRWVPSAFDPDRYGREDVNASVSKPYDVVVIANRNSPRLRGHPNWKDRIKFVEVLQHRLGERIAVFGKGWSGPSAMGPVDWASQDDAIKLGWMSANWDHYAQEPSYFSNRLPISLASGSIHATTWHPGYDSIFGPASDSFLILGRTIEQLVDDIVEKLESTGPSERIEAAVRARHFAHQHFRQDDQLVGMLNHTLLRINPLEAREAWDLAAAPLNET